MIGAPALAALLRRDRAIVLAALIAVTVLAWADVLHLVNTMSGADMYASGMMSPVFAQWTGEHFITMLAMWTVMMIGMMTPSVPPMILIYAQVARSNARVRPFASALWFAGGYLLAWAAGEGRIMHDIDLDTDRPAGFIRRIVNFLKERV